MDFCVEVIVPLAGQYDDRIATQKCRANTQLVSGI